jgi:hypothetical protein
MTNDQNISSQANLRPCSHCSSTQIVSGVEINQGIEIGSFGLVYKALGPMRGTERLLADLCLNCGTVTRFFVRNTQKKWVCR